MRLPQRLGVSPRPTKLGQALLYCLRVANAISPALEEMAFCRCFRWPAKPKVSALSWLADQSGRGECAQWQEARGGFVAGDGPSVVVDLAEVEGQVHGEVHQETAGGDHLAVG